MSDTEEYFEDQRSWAQNAAASERKSKRFAWTIALIALVLVGLQSLAIFALLPLKTKETVPILVDRTTGFTQVLEPDGTQSLRADEALVQSLLAQYVVARERLDPGLINRDYRKTVLWSSGLARESYVGLIARQNPNSPLRNLGDNGSLAVAVKSVSQIAPGQALVRFDTFRDGGSSTGDQEGSWIAALNYEFLDAPMSFDDRLLNPLGIQISTYRRDPERPAKARITSPTSTTVEVVQPQDAQSLAEERFVE